MYLSLVSGAPFAAGAVAREHHSPEMRMSDECDEKQQSVVQDGGSGYCKEHIRQPSSPSSCSATNLPTYQPVVRERLTCVRHVMSCLARATDNGRRHCSSS